MWVMCCYLLRQFVFNMLFMEISVLLSFMLLTFYLLFILRCHLGQERHIRKDGVVLEHRGGVHLSRYMHEFIDQCLRQKMSSSTIVAEAKSLHLQRMQLQYNLPSQADVLEALDKGKIPMHRDFSVNAKDVSNRRAALEKQLSKPPDNDDRGRTPQGRESFPAAAVRPLEVPSTWNSVPVAAAHPVVVPSSAQSEMRGRGGIIFRQLFDMGSGTYTYLLADATTKEAVLIDPVREHVRLLTALSGTLTVS